MTNHDFEAVSNKLSRCKSEQEKTITVYNYDFVGDDPDFETIQFALKFAQMCKEQMCKEGVVSEKVSHAGVDAANMHITLDWKGNPLGRKSSPDSEECCSIFKAMIKRLFKELEVEDGKV